MRICKHFEKSDITGKCKNYKGDKKESCACNCSKIKGKEPKDTMELIVE